MSIDYESAAAGVHLPWETICSSCNGSGKVDQDGKPAPQYRESTGISCSCHYDRKCSLCEGTGAEPTEEGEALLGFMKRHLQVSSTVR